MNKLYNRIDFHNNTTPALNDANLNAISKAIDDIDTRVCNIADDVLEGIPTIKEELPKVMEAIEDASSKIPIMEQLASNAEASADEAEEWANKAEEWAQTAHTTEVIVNPIVTSGQHIADITVNGETTAIHCTGGGGGGASSYDDLDPNSLPQINGVTLIGDKGLDAFGIASAEALSDLADLVGQANAILEEV